MPGTAARPRGPGGLSVGNQSGGVPGAGRIRGSTVALRGRLGKRRRAVFPEFLGKGMDSQEQVCRFLKAGITEGYPHHLRGSTFPCRARSLLAGQCVHSRVTVVCAAGREPRCELSPKSRSDLQIDADRRAKLWILPPSEIDWKRAVGEITKKAFPVCSVNLK